MVSAQGHGSSGPGSSPDRGTALCSWARYFTLTMPLFTKVYKWVTATASGAGTPTMDLHPIQGDGRGVGGSKNTPSCFVLLYSRIE